MKWDKYSLNKIIKIKHGYAFKGKFFSEEPTNDILLTPGNFNIGGGFKSHKFKYYKADFPVDYILNENDVIVTMTDLSKQADTLGFSAKVPFSDGKRFLHNQRIGLVELINDRFDINFIYWLMRTYSYQKFIANSSTGSTVKHTSPTKICSYEFNAPNKTKQRKIASILSAYDDLIENNLKRIKLLEEKAFLTYKILIQDTLINPGTKKKKLRDILDLKYGKSLKSDERIIGTYPVFGSSGIIGSHDKYLVEGPGIIVGRKGNVGTVFWSSENFWPIDTVYFVESKISLYFLYFNLKEQHFVNTDAAVPGLNRSFAIENPIILPREDEIYQFEKTVIVFFKLIWNLQQQNTKIREARDILLPKLMNGEIEV